jgi:hypothetical protein
MAMPPICRCFSRFRASPVEPVERPIERRLPVLAHGLLALLAVASVWSVDYLPTHDGPQHIFGVHAAQRLDEPDTGYGRFLAPNVPLTAHGFAMVFAPFDAWLPWRTATRIALSCMVLLWSVGTFLLARAVEPRRAWIGVGLAALAFQWSLYMGLFSYYVATAFGLCVLAVALAPEPWSRARNGAVAGLLFAQALMHVMSAAISGAALLAIAAARAPRGACLRASGRRALVGVPAACLAAAMFATGLVDDLARNANGITEGWTPARTPLWSVAGCFAGGPAWRAWLPPLLALSAPLAIWRLRRTSRGTDLGLLIAGAALLAIALAAPLHLHSWDFFSVRFLPTALCCLALAWPLERLPSLRLRRLAGAALAVWALAAGGWALVENRALARRAAGALAGLDADIVRDGPRLPIVLDPFLGQPLDARRASVPFAVPLANLGQLYATAQGGYVPHSFALNWQIHPVVMREEARRAFPPTVDRTYAWDLVKPAFAHDRELREAMTIYLGAIGTRYQDVILWGRPEDAELLIRLGYEPEFRRGGLLLARFRGCPLTVTFPAATPPPPVAGVELGWLPVWHVTHRYAIDKIAPDASGRRAVSLATTPCAGAWLRLVDAAGESSIECEGADAEGRLRVASVRTTPEVECRVRPRALRAAHSASVEEAS